MDPLLACAAIAFVVLVALMLLERHDRRVRPERVALTVDPYLLQTEEDADVWLRELSDDS